MKEFTFLVIYAKGSSSEATVLVNACSFVEALIKAERIRELDGATDGSKVTMRRMNKIEA